MLNLAPLATCTVTTVISQDGQESLKFSLHPLTAFTCSNLPGPPLPLPRLPPPQKKVQSLTYLRLDKIDPSSKLWIIQRDAIGDDVQKDFFLHVVVNTMPKAFLLA